jgi:hypothetical protein
MLNVLLQPVFRLIMTNNRCPLNLYTVMTCRRNILNFTVVSLTQMKVRKPSLLLGLGYRQNTQGSVIQGVPLPTKHGISFIILKPMKILQRNRHTLQTHSSSILTRRTYSCSNLAAICSLVLELLKKCRVW